MSTLLRNRRATAAPVAAPSAAPVVKEVVKETPKVVVQEKETPKTKDGAQAALVVEPIFSSPDSSVTITFPAAEGEGYKFSALTTFTTTDNIVATYTPGTPTTAPSVAMSVPDTAIVGDSTGGLIPVSVSYNAGIFGLGVDASSISGVLPRTVVVGGVVGTTPNAATLDDALALLPAGPYPANEPWTLLFAPGVYTSGVAAVIPPNVNLVALEPGSVVLQQDLSITDVSLDAIESYVVGIRFVSDLTWDMTGKTGSTSTLRVLNSYISGSFTGSMREVDITTPVLGVYRDQVLVSASELTGAVALAGGMTNLKSTRTAGTFAATLTSNGINSTSRLQVDGGSFSPSAFTQTNSFSSFRSAALGGVWQTSGATSSCLITGCNPSSTGTAGGATLWTLTCNSSSTATIKDTPLVTVVERVDTLSWTISQPNLLPATVAPDGSVDRDLAFTLLGVAAAPTGANLTAAFEVPLTTSFQAATDVPPYTQDPVSTSSVSGPSMYPSTLLSNAEELVIITQSTFSTKADVSIQVPSAATQWYP